MVLLLATSLLLLLASALLVMAHRRERALSSQLAGVSHDLKALTLRLAAAEDDIGHAFAQAEVAENLLVEKGVADQDDVDAMRARQNAAGAGGYVRLRDGDLH